MIINEKHDDRLMIPVPDVLTPREAADLLGITTRRLSDWADKGRVSYVRTLGGHRRYAGEEISLLRARAGRLPATIPPAPETAKGMSNAGDSGDDGRHLGSGDGITADRDGRGPAR